MATVNEIRYGILLACQEYVTKNKIRVPRPLDSVLNKNLYPPQIGIGGATMWYRTPASDGSKIIGAWNTLYAVGVFDADGIKEKDLGGGFVVTLNNWGYPAINKIQ